MGVARAAAEAAAITTKPKGKFAKSFNVCFNLPNSARTSTYVDTRVLGATILNVFHLFYIQYPHVYIVNPCIRIFNILCNGICPVYACISIYVFILYIYRRITMSTTHTVKPLRIKRREFEKKGILLY